MFCLQIDARAGHICNELEIVNTALGCTLCTILFIASQAHATFCKQNSQNKILTNPYYYNYFIINQTIKIVEHSRYLGRYFDFSMSDKQHKFELYNKCFIETFSAFHCCELIQSMAY